MTKEELELRQGIIEACRSMNALGVNQGTSGNISARHGDVMLITPSGVPYDQLKPADIAEMTLTGAYGDWSGPLQPSSEWRFHLDIMRSRPEVGSVVHTHSTYATVLAICGKEIPAIQYMVAASGGPTIRVAPYETYGTPALSTQALAALKDRSCCLLRNHGVIATGANVKRALWLAVEVETLARQYYLSLSIGGAQVLSDAEIAHVIEKFKSYGPRPKPAGKAARGRQPAGGKTAARQRAGSRGR
jgi:L-fuculose-phosphate aldolase